MGIFDLFRRKIPATKAPDEPAAEDSAAGSPFAHLADASSEAERSETPESDSSADPDSILFSKSVLPSVTVGVYYPDSGVFLIRHPDRNKTGFLCRSGIEKSALLPLCGDWNGDGLDGIGLYDGATGLFMLRNSLKDDDFEMAFSFGPAGRRWLPIVGDWNGDGIQSVGVYDPSDGAFFLTDNFDGGDAGYAFRFGPPDKGWIPLAGDWNGDGRQTIGLYDPEDGYFYLRNDNSGGEADMVIPFKPGQSAMLPLVGDWTDCGQESVGLYDPETSTFHLRENEMLGVISFQFGSRSPNAMPISLLWRP